MSLQNWVQKHLPNSTQQDGVSTEVFYRLDVDKPVTFECGVHWLKLGTRYCILCLLNATGEVYDYWRDTWTGYAYVLATYNTQESMLRDWFAVPKHDKKVLWRTVLPLARSIKK